MRVWLWLTIYFGLKVCAWRSPVLCSVTRSRQRLPSFLFLLLQRLELRLDEGDTFDVTDLEFLVLKKLQIFVLIKVLHVFEFLYAIQTHSYKRRTNKGYP